MHTKGLATCAHLLLLIPAAIYAASVAYAFLIGAPLPAGYLFRTLAPDRWLNVTALWLPIALLILCAFSFIVSWLLYWSPLRERARDLEQHFLGQLHWTGLALTIVLLTFLIGSGGWGRLRQARRRRAVHGVCEFGALFGRTRLCARHIRISPPTAAWDRGFRDPPVGGGLPQHGQGSRRATAIPHPLSYRCFFVSASLLFRDAQCSGRWIGLWPAAAFLAFSLFFTRYFMASAIDRIVGAGLVVHRRRFSGGRAAMPQLRKRSRRHRLHDFRTTDPDGRGVRAANARPLGADGVFNASYPRS